MANTEGAKCGSEKPIIYWIKCFFGVSKNCVNMTINLKTVYLGIEGNTAGDDWLARAEIILRIYNYVVEIFFDTGKDNGFKELGQVG